MSLTPLGGSLSGYVFDLSSGSLPAGIELTPEGIIRGTPTEFGNYNPVLRLRDSSGAVTTRQFELSVSEDLSARRWAVIARESLDLVDNASPDRKRTTLVADWRAVTGVWSGAPRGVFSPDGMGLVYPELSAGDAGIALKYIDLSSGVPSAPVQISKGGEKSVQIEWAPDSKHLAYSARRGEDRAVLYVDVSTSNPKLAVEVATPFQAAESPDIHWLDARTLVYELKSSTVFGPSDVHYVRVAVDNSIRTTSVKCSGSIRYGTSPASLSCGTSTGSTQYVNLETGAAFQRSMSFSPNHHYFSARSEDAAQALQLFRLAPDGKTTVLAELGDGFRSSVWNAESNVYSGISDRVEVIRLGDGVVHRSVICGDYPGGGVLSYPRFSPDSTWLAFHGKSGVANQTVFYVAGIRNGAAQAATELNRGAAIDSLSFSPDSGKLAFLLKSGPLFISNLEAGVAGTPRVVAQPNKVGTIYSLSWSGDSSTLMFLAGDVGTSELTRYALDANDPNAEPKVVKR
jgi:WD40 repeat protein